MKIRFNGTCSVVVGDRPLKKGDILTCVAPEANSVAHYADTGTLITLLSRADFERLEESTEEGETYVSREEGGM